MTAPSPVLASELTTLLERLRGALPELRRRYPLGSLALFGSRARGTGHADSDLDMLVEWNGPVSLLDYAGLRADLEDLTGQRVELTNRRLLKPALAAAIIGEAIAV